MRRIAVLCLMALATTAGAQSLQWSKPVRILVGASPGGALDPAARVLSERVGQRQVDHVHQAPDAQVGYLDRGLDAATGADDA